MSICQVLKFHVRRSALHLYSLFYLYIYISIHHIKTLFIVIIFYIYLLHKILSAHRPRLLCPQSFNLLTIGSGITKIFFCSKKNPETFPYTIKKFIFFDYQCALNPEQFRTYDHYVTYELHKSGKCHIFVTDDIDGYFCPQIYTTIVFFCG